MFNTQACHNSAKFCSVKRSCRTAISCLPPAAQMDDASWDKLFTTATLTDYQTEDVVRALPGSGWGRDGACVSVPRLGVL